jgi:recombination protein RecA
MPSAAALRLEIERTLEHRFPAALTPAPKTIYEVAPTGVAPVDALLEGGMPVGAISEVTGPESSGRTSLTLAFLAGRTEAGQVCAWVDAGDAFDPESAAASGVGFPEIGDLPA